LAIADQQTGKATAIDEEVAGDLLAIGQFDRLDKACFAVAVDVDNPPFLAPHAQPLGKGAQEAGVERGVKVIGVEEFGKRCGRLAGGAAVAKPARAPPTLAENIPQIGMPGLRRDSRNHS
jgi:hypothetical protein